MASVWVLYCHFCVTLTFICSVYGNVPVLLWESRKTDRIKHFSALRRVSRDEFHQYLLKKVHGEQPVPLITIFTEENLSMEDYSWQDSLGHGYFPQLKYITEISPHVEFLPSVQHPIEASKRLSKYGYPLQYINADQNENLPDGCGKILVVNLQEAKPYEDRPELMRRHDKTMNEMYSQLLSKCSHVIGMHTGNQSSWMEVNEVSRMRRSVDNDTTPVVQNTTYALYQDTKGFSLLYSTSQPNLTYDGKEINLGNYPVYVSGDNSKPSEIKLFARYGTDYRITFNFDNKTTGYWCLVSVNLVINNNPEIVLSTPLDIVAPLPLSFHIGNKVSFRNGTTALTFPNMQVQPFFLLPGSKAFGAAVDAVGFFTPAIWSGIFVTFLLAIIFTWGISMIMDIRTMDQFDDPKGKTITVSATD